MFIDTHAHYDDAAFNEDRDELLEAIHAAGVDTIINCGTDLKTCEMTLRMMQKHKWMVGAMGVHPENIKGLDIDHIATIADYIERSDRVVAVGEIGLDYHYEGFSKRAMQEWFVEQIELAKEMDLPIIVHSRDAAQDTMDIIKESDAAMVGGVIHCFSGSVEMAREYVKMGFHIGVGGMVTFKNSKRAQEMVTEIPLEYLLLETDAPYMAPVPHRGKRNDSREIVYVAQKIAELKNISVEQVYEQTTKNAIDLFGLDL